MKSFYDTIIFDLTTQSLTLFSARMGESTFTKFFSKNTKRIYKVLTPFQIKLKEWSFFDGNSLPSI
jgi:hypothetical protein